MGVCSCWRGIGRIIWRKPLRSCRDILDGGRIVWNIWLVRNHPRLDHGGIVHARLVDHLLEIEEENWRVGTVYRANSVLM